MNEIHYDLIGDIHGQYAKLAGALERLGYRCESDGFRAPAGRRAVFLGDLIDPKPGNACPGGVRATLRVVRALCERGDAHCLMGNHELNAIYFHSKGPDGKWLRHHGDKNVRMHQGTLDDFPDHADPAGEWRREWLPWLMSLPFFLDLGGLRAVHAAWHPEMIERVAGCSLEDPEFFLAGASKHSPQGEALEVLLKGVEVELPANVSYVDHAGVVRPNMRVCWWEQPMSGIGYDELVFPSNPQIPKLPVEPHVLAQIPGYALDAPPVFFGHYFKPANAPLRPERHNVACLDHSAAKDGPLVAYRWQGEAFLEPEHYLVHAATLGPASVPVAAALHGAICGQ